MRKIFSEAVMLMYSLKKYYVPAKGRTGELVIFVMHAHNTSRSHPGQFR